MRTGVAGRFVFFPPYAEAPSSPQGSVAVGSATALAAGDSEPATEAARWGGGELKICGIGIPQGASSLGFGGGRGRKTAGWLSRGLLEDLVYEGQRGLEAG